MINIAVMKTEGGIVALTSVLRGDFSSMRNSKLHVCIYIACVLNDNLKSSNVFFQNLIRAIL